MTKKKKGALDGSHQVQKFIRYFISSLLGHLGFYKVTNYRAVDETKSWMNEKDTALLSDDYGRDLASVQALQRKHEGLERDLAALEEKVRVLRMDASQLVGAQPAASWNVRGKEKEIVDAWMTVKSRVSPCSLHQRLTMSKLHDIYRRVMPVVPSMRACIVFFYSLKHVAPSLLTLMTFNVS